jgi:hypothetical protein
MTTRFGAMCARDQSSWAQPHRTPRVDSTHRARPNEEVDPRGLVIAASTRMTPARADVTTGGRAPPARVGKASHTFASAAVAATPECLNLGIDERCQRPLRRRAGSRAVAPRQMRQPRAGVGGATALRSWHTGSWRCHS